MLWWKKFDGGGGEESDVLWLGPDGGIGIPFGYIPKSNFFCKILKGGGGEESDVLWLGPDGGIMPFGYTLKMEFDGGGGVGSDVVGFDPVGGIGLACV